MSRRLCLCACLATGLFVAVVKTDEPLSVTEAAHWAMLDKTVRNVKQGRIKLDKHGMVMLGKKQDVPLYVTGEAKSPRFVLIVFSDAPDGNLRGYLHSPQALETGQKVLVRGPKLTQNCPPKSK